MWRIMMILAYYTSPDCTGDVYDTGPVVYGAIDDALGNETYDPARGSDLVVPVMCDGDTTYLVWLGTPTELSNLEANIATFVANPALVLNVTQGVCKEDLAVTTHGSIFGIESDVTTFSIIINATTRDCELARPSPRCVVHDLTPVVVADCDSGVAPAVVPADAPVVTSKGRCYSSKCTRAMTGTLIAVGCVLAIALVVGVGMQYVDWRHGYRTVP